LADYGVSRSVLPSGTKGLAGTPPFIAPEIIQHNGEESYTEKVDCFSFGMFIYELLTLKLPFDGMSSAALGAGGANLKGYVLSGGRPVLTLKVKNKMPECFSYFISLLLQELSYPMYILDLMSLCWSHDPLDRPSAAEMVSILSSSEVTQILNVISVGPATEVMCACAAPCRLPEESLLGRTVLHVFTVKENCSFVDSNIDFTGIVCDVWLSCRDPSTLVCTLQVYTYTEDRCIQAKVCKL
jgi:serine/threonine protein kinase